MSTTDLEQPNFDTKRSHIDDNDDGTDWVYSKRRRISNDELEGGWWRKPAEIKLSHDDYTVGWICALPIELAASHAMLDKVHKSLPTVDNDTNAYILGSIGEHNIAMACLPSGQYGTNNAATVTGNMMRSFKSIRFGFMVGIGGGVPGEIDIRLGDIVVGTSVVQHDLGKIVEGTGFQGTGTPRIPPQLLLNAVSKLRALHEAKDSQVVVFLREMQERYPKLVEYALPSSSEDRLFRVTKNHDHGHSGSCGSCSVVEVCDRISRNDKRPRIHYGGIASGNQVIKCSQRRDELAKEHNIICFEMEAAGLSDALPTIVVRGICDYADSQKNKEWQKYAAATAAAYAKELMSVITPSESSKVSNTQTPEQPLDKSPEALKARREALLQSLRFEQIDARQATIKRAHSKTCEWLLTDSSYKQWLDPSRIFDHHGFLWISGKPGAGKSTIMKFAFGRAKRTTRKGSAVISFFFNARGDILEKSTFGLYRSLLLQLLERFPDLQTDLDDSILAATTQKDCPAIDEIQGLFRNAIAALGQRQLVCFIDALDECNETQVRDMVVFFEDLGEEAVANKIQLRTCFSSRHYPHIDIRCGLRLILEDQAGHGRDLDRYIKSYLRAGNGKYVDDIRSKILTKAGGVFMWVVLVVQVLNTEFIRGRRTRVEQRLHEIPDGLSDLFKDILKRDATNMEDLLLCIQWVLFAKRPLTLREFYFGMLSGLPELQNEPTVHDPEYDTDEMMRIFVTGSSKGLAEITKSATGTVQFIHESVKDFLIKDDGLRELWPHLRGNFEGVSHERLKMCCQSHVTGKVIDKLELPKCLPDASWDKAKKMRQTCSQKFPFLEYAGENLFYHANLAAEKSSQDTFLDHLQLEGWIRIANVFEKYQTRRYLSTASLTYILADKNFPNLLRGHIHRQRVCDIQEERYGYPLFAALANKHWAAVNVLLGRVDTALPNEKLFPLVNYRKEFDSAKGHNLHPLNWAISTGHHEVAELIISSGLYDCFRTDTKQRYALHWASITGSRAVMEMLLERTPLCDKRVPSPACAVDEPTGNEEAIKRAERRLYLNRTDCNGDSPLSLACTYLEEDVIRVLLNFGADFSECRPCQIQVSCESKLNKWLAEFLMNQALLSEMDVLKIAMRRGIEELVEFILSRKGLTHHTGHFDGAKFLEDAASFENKSVFLELLTVRGIGVGSRRWDFGKRLLQAAASSDETFAQILLENGAKMEPGDSLIGMPIENGHEPVVKLLLENNAHVDKRGYWQETLLHRASFEGNVAVVRVLLAYGAQVHACNSSGQTPLHMAALGSHQQVARILIAGGASVHCLNHNNQTPLHLASLCGHNGLRKFFRDASTKAQGANKCLQDSTLSHETMPDSNSSSVTGLRNQTMTPAPQSPLRRAPYYEERLNYIVIDDSETTESMDESSKDVEVIEIESTDDEL